MRNLLSYQIGVFASVLAIGFCCPTDVGAQKSLTEYSAAQQAVVQAYISGKPGVSFMPESRFDTAYFKEVRAWYGASAKPYFASGDFNKDGLKDFAVVLLSESGRSKKLVVVVFNNVGGKSYRVADVSEEDFNTSFCIGPEKAGKHTVLTTVRMEQPDQKCYTPKGKGYMIDFCCTL